MGTQNLVLTLLPDFPFPSGIISSYAAHVQRDDSNEYIKFPLFPRGELSQLSPHIFFYVLPGYRLVPDPNRILCGQGVLRNNLVTVQAKAPVLLTELAVLNPLPPRDFWKTCLPQNLPSTFYRK